ncbi:MAG: hypothetical protein AAFR53_02640 [Pseudomonadota bacterium]
MNIAVNLSRVPSVSVLALCAGAAFACPADQSASTAFMLRGGNKEVVILSTESIETIIASDRFQQDFPEGDEHRAILDNLKLLEREYGRVGFFYPADGDCSVHVMKDDYADSPVDILIGTDAANGTPCRAFKRNLGVMLHKMMSICGFEMPGAQADLNEERIRTVIAELEPSSFVAGADLPLANTQFDVPLPYATAQNGRLTSDQWLEIARANGAMHERMPLALGPNARHWTYEPIDFGVPRSVESDTLKDYGARLRSAQVQILPSRMHYSETKGFEMWVVGDAGEGPEQRSVVVPVDLGQALIVSNSPALLGRSEFEGAEIVVYPTNVVGALSSDAGNEAASGVYRDAMILIAENTSELALEEFDTILSETASSDTFVSFNYSFLDEPFLGLNTNSALAFLARHGESISDLSPEMIRFLISP